ncbi:MAG TPA: hypothetical protein VGJ28_03585, partial [Micromonosporaceae bacterium]
WSARPRRLAGAVAIAAVALLASGATDRPFGYAGVAIGFGLVTFATVAMNVRLQHSISGDARATVTSIAEVCADLAAIAVFGACALASSHMSVITLLAAFGLPLLLLAAAVSRLVR